MSEAAMEHGQVQFYAYTHPTLPSPMTTPFLAAFKEPSDLVTIVVRGKDGAHGSITITPDEAMRFSMALGASKFANRRYAAITINGQSHTVPSDEDVPYERLVEIAGLTGTPSMTVQFGQRDRAGCAPTPGTNIRLDHGAHVTVVHTGNA